MVAMGLSWLDAALFLYLLLHLLVGFQQGLFLGGMNLVAFLGGLGMGLGLAQPLAAWLGGPAWLHGLWPAAIVFGLAKLLESRIVKRWGPSLGDRPRLQRLDRWFGLLPGAVWAAMGAGVVAWFVTAFAGGLPPNSPIAATMLGLVKAPLAELGAAIPQDRPHR
ncbi:MAG: hypothetical protein JWM80_6244 [Cyanobacteria bacterium RYN_339]|nr:hypothetical protein [Cyanobacteria bacterium RYN_339]